MRDLKFRALSKGKWWYSNDEAYVLKNIDGKLYLVEMENFYNTKDIQESIIGEAFQFTGMKDCKGVEIFEGDIIMTHYERNVGSYFEPEDESGEYKGLVHYTPSQGFVLRRCIFKDDESEKWEKRKVLTIKQSSAYVIGNIFESPELLDKDSA